ncbi:MAG: DUF3343 domain-containing protein [Eubacteriales bacterium]|nr:DUF3343 domain-containing protein [Eubacteriales bacterium]
MRKKQLCTVITFATTTDAMGMEATAAKSGFAGRLIPVPGELSAGCGMAWKSVNQTNEEAIGFLQEHQLSFDGVYQVLL